MFVETKVIIKDEARTRGVSLQAEIFLSCQLTDDLMARRIRFG